MLRLRFKIRLRVRLKFRVKFNVMVRFKVRVLVTVRFTVQKYCRKIILCRRERFVVMWAIAKPQEINEARAINVDNIFHDV